MIARRKPSQALNLASRSHTRPYSDHVHVVLEFPRERIGEPRKLVHQAAFPSMHGRWVILNLPGHDPHDMDCGADQVGGAPFSFGASRHR